MQSIGEPEDIAVDTDHNRIFVASFSHPSILYVIDGFASKVTLKVQFDGRSQDIAYDPFNGNVYIYVYGYVLALNTTVRPI